MGRCVGTFPDSLLPIISPSSPTYSSSLPWPFPDFHVVPLVQVQAHTFLSLTQFLAGGARRQFALVIPLWSRCPSLLTLQ